MATTATAEDGAGRPPRKRKRNRNRNRSKKPTATAAPEPVEREDVDTLDDDDLEEDDERTTRAQEARGESVHDEDDYEDDWEEPDLLDAPPPRPGYVQRWIRTLIHGQGDPGNVAKRSNQRWRPRPADTVPKGFSVPTIQHGQHAGCIGIEGMVLMERPEKAQRARRRKNRELTRMQMEGVESDLHQVHDPSSGLGQPTLKSRSKVERGRRVAAADDD